MSVLQFQFISDFHLEHRTWPIKFEDYIKVPVRYNVNVNVNESESVNTNTTKTTISVLGLLGDIGSPYDPKIETFLAWCSKHFDHVLYIIGNHEYYSAYGDSMDVLKKELCDICSQYPNVRVLDNQSFVIGKYRFVGSTLWSYIPTDPNHEMELFIENYLNDYRLIYSNKTKKRILANETRALFLENVRFIRDELDKANQLGQLAFVLTHHAPSFYQTSAPEFSESDSQYGFCSDVELTSEQKNRIQMWCCGHTHFNFHHHHEGYELRSNQIGYSQSKNLHGFRNDVLYEFRL